MANIRVDLDGVLYNGMDIVFRTPCDCSGITGIAVYHSQLDGTTNKTIFKLKDAHNNDVSNLSDLFASGVLIKVLLDVANGYAYILNADTNSYIENKKLPMPPTAQAGQYIVVSSIDSNGKVTGTQAIDDNKIPVPPTAQVGQYITVSSVDDNGRVTGTKAVTIEIYSGEIEQV